MDLKNKVVIVTGSGGGGSGRAIARRFAREGSLVVVTDVNEPGGNETVRLIDEENGRAAFFAADIGVEEHVRHLLGFAESTYGGVDVLINNASAPYHPDAPLEYWFETIQVDLLGAVYGTRHCIDAMRKRGGGAIVNVASVSALGHGRKHAQVAAYDVAKAGVIRLTTALAWLQERERIRVNCLVPGWITSPQVQAYVDSLTPEQRRERGVPDVLITLEEIAGAIVKLATDETLAGRVMVWWNGAPPRLIAQGDPGYAALE
jgi:NAD(P)-dependent dehydrogenase (short-subunit alcohol dehydrogenase family)